MQDKQSMDVVTCPVTATHETTACVPVSICPFADYGPISIESCGCPVIHSGSEACCGIVNGRYEFSVSQKMKINIPIAFGADIQIGDTYVHNGQTCGTVDGDCCTCNCSECENTLEIPEETI